MFGLRTVPSLFVKKTAKQPLPSDQMMIYPNLNALRIVPLIILVINCFYIHYFLLIYRIYLFLLVSYCLHVYLLRVLSLKSYSFCNLSPVFIVFVAKLLSHLMYPSDLASYDLHRSSTVVIAHYMFLNLVDCCSPYCLFYPIFLFINFIFMHFIYSQYEHSHIVNMYLCYSTKNAE